MFLIASTFVKRFMDSDAQALNISPALSGVGHVQGIILHSRHAGSDAWRTSERRPERVFYVEKLVGCRYFGKVSKGKSKSKGVEIVSYCQL